MNTKYSLIVIIALAISCGAAASDAGSSINGSTFHYKGKADLNIQVNNTLKIGQGDTTAIYDIVGIESLLKTSCKQCPSYGSDHALLTVQRPASLPGLVQHCAVHVRPGQISLNGNVNGSDVSEIPKINGTVEFEWVPMAGHTMVFNTSLSPLARNVLLAGGALGVATAYVYRNELKSKAKKTAHAIDKLIKKATGSSNAPIKSKL